MKEKIKEYEEDLKECRENLKSVKTWYKLIPNLLTVSRPIGMIPANILFFTGNVVPAIILTSLLLLTDLFDGKLARKWNCQSKFGADLDAVCDKLMFVGLSLPLIINYPLFIVNFLLEGAIASVNVLGRLKGLDTKTVYSGKIKTWFLSLTLGMGYLVKFFNINPMFLKSFMTITTFCQGYSLGEYVSEYKKMSKEKNNIRMEEEKGIVFEGLNDMEQDEFLEHIDLELQEEKNINRDLTSRENTGKRRVRRKEQ